MKLRSHVLCGCALFAVGCAGGSSDRGNGGQEDSGETGLAIRTAITDTDSDVSYIEYTIERVACVDGEELEPMRRTVRAELRPTPLPGGVPRMENGPLDGVSKHGFTDHFEVLPAGCYDVAAAPYTAGDAASASCGSARANRIEVLDGNTTEVFLLSQCSGQEVGAVDAVAAFNRPPQLVGLTFSPSKFITAGGSTTVCATVTDPDGDQLELAWSQVGAEAGEAIRAGQQGPAAPGEAAGGITECVEISLGEAGDYLFEVRIYDMLRDENNRMTRFETWYENKGSPNASNDSLRFPVYVGEAAAEPQPPEEPAQPEQPEEGEQPAQPEQPEEGEQPAEGQ